MRKMVSYKCTIKLAVVAHTYSPSPWYAEAEGA
jgi:hypothetical protein